MCCRYKRGIVLFIQVIFTLCILQHITAGAYLSVPLDDPVYQILESAQIRGLINRLPSTKPYSSKTVNDALAELLQSSSTAPDNNLTKTETAIVKGSLRKHIDKNTIGAREESSVLSTGAISYDSQYLRADMGEEVALLNGAALSLNSSETAYGTEDFLNLYLSGDLGNDLYHEDPLLSFKFDMGFGAVSIAGQTYTRAKLTTLDQTVFAPYTFTPEWEGYSYSLLDPFNNGNADDDLYIAFSMDPEISTQLFGDHLKMSLSRIPRNWGLGEDSLLLSEQASPFVSFSMEAKIYDWMDYSFLVGALENNGDSSTSSALQNMISLRSVDVRPTDWLYIGVQEAVIWPKRLEFGYLNPLIFSSLYQGMIGDYDNIYGGLSLGLSVPKHIDFYGSFYFDEFRPASFKDLFERVRNFFSFQIGLKASIPPVISALSFSTLTIQYTKIEPFTYTHPLTEVPWVQSESGIGIDGKVYESFVTNGDGICSKLDPNSDELLVKAETLITSSIVLHGAYQMIRHGEYGGDYNQPLESYSGASGDNGILPEDMGYPDWLGGGTAKVGDLRKSFLHDGDYDWYHIVALGGALDLQEIVNLPIKLKATNSLVYQFRTDEDLGLVYNTADLTNYLTVAVQIWGE